MDEIMNRLSELILNEMGKNNQSCLCFSELCGVGRNIVGDIINKKKTDIKLSTIVHICENSKITYADIFACKDDFDSKKIEDKLSTFVLSNGKVCFALKRVR